MPKIRKREKISHYVSRCIRFVMSKEGASQAHAVAKCIGMSTSPKWGRKPKKRGKKKRK